jgi:glycosyltransferase 2 family protein
VVLAFATGVTVGAGVLVLFGVPDRRSGPGEIAAALGSAYLPVTCVEPAAVEAKGSRAFTAVTGDGKSLFIKVLGSDQRDADLLYRAYRFIRLREVGDTRPAASLIQAVEHQALAAVMAERAEVAVPAVRQVIKAGDGSALLAMDRVDGSSLDLIPAQAALVAGLNGVGMAAGPAVSAVLLYRLTTYWLPIAPGWLAWRVLQQREYA